MNKISIALSVLLLGLPAFGANEYAIKKVQPAMVLTPDITFQGTQHKTGRSEQWLEVEISFETSVPMTDELTFKYYVLMNGKVLSGEVTHVDISAGRELYSVMYVSPRGIQRVTDGKPNSIAIQNAAVQILKAGQVVAEKSFKGSGQWWAQGTPLPGILINKNETPFAPLYWDRYEAIKSIAK